MNAKVPHPHERCPYTSDALISGSQYLLSPQGCCLFCALHEVICPVVTHPPLCPVRRASSDYSNSVYVLAVKNEQNDGLELSGNCFAVGNKIVVTAFHNIYDELVHNIYDENFTSPDFLLRTEHSENKKDVLLRIWKFAVLSQRVQKLDNVDIFISPVLVQFVEGNYSEDWAILQLVSDVTEYCGIQVAQQPSNLIYLPICPVNELPLRSGDKLKTFYFSVALYKTSKDPTDELQCECTDFNRIIVFKTSCSIFRVLDSLDVGSSGSPSVNESGQVVTLHLASLDSSMEREHTTRFRQKKARTEATPRLSEISIKSSKISVDMMKEVDDVLSEESSRLGEELRSLGNTQLSYREGFTLSKSDTFMALLSKHN